MGARECNEPFANCLGEVPRRRGKARAERYQAACKREQVLDTVIHFPDEEALLLLSPSALGNVACDF